ncbi:hypothetical protein CNMCM5793_006496 [Aspergillus hiratsukae]|uniref:Uncharacterized protein n=1 Tax=Aspergillus hiratsukae TaxID=1194566 RepID=A0A8H6PHY2_9EURO|nr:hypothetical protein CNMCM5793_006496 [Aspergillus hiratsukae]KAF7173297.1 hypothetical protein CNMCM6106_007412 [Aspergillus hiratsukae]
MDGLRTIKDPEVDSGQVFDVIAIHGPKEGESTWEPSDNFSYDYVGKFSRFPNTRVSVYASTLLREQVNIFAGEALRLEAIRLLEAIGNRGRTGIAFIGHDIGGTLIKEIFLGCPHHVQSSLVLQRSLHRLLCLGGFGRYRPSMALAARLADVVTAINLDFMETKIPLLARIRDVYSTSSNDEDRVLDLAEEPPISTSMIKWHRIATRLSHCEMPGKVEPDLGIEAESVVEDSLEDVKTIATLVLQAPEPRLIGGLARETQDAAPPEQDLNIQELRDWISSPGKPLLAIHDAQDTQEVCMAIRSQLMVNETRMIHFFEFAHWDCRYDRVECMFLSFIAQIAPQAAEAYSGTSRLQELGEGLEESGLDTLFNIYFDSILLPKHRLQVVWILVGLEKRVGSHQWLLDKLRALATCTDVKIKVALVNCPGHERPLDLPSELTITMTVGGKGDRELEGSRKIDYIDPMALHLIAEHTHLYPMWPDINRLFEHCVKDLELRESLAAWLRASSLNSESSGLGQIVHAMSTQETAVILRQIIESAVSYPREPELALLTLELITLSLRAVTAQELLDWEKASLDWDLRRDGRALHAHNISSRLPGVMTVRLNRVHLYHSSMRDVILSGDQPRSTGVHLGNRHERAAAHARIALSCLQYLTSSHGRQELLQRYQSVGDGEDPPAAIPESHESFLSYAVRFWPRHAKLAGQAFDYTSTVLQTLLDDPDLLDIWSRAFLLHYCTSIGGPRFIYGGTGGPLAILAGHGLLKVLCMARGRSGIQWRRPECSAGLISAAYNAQSDVARLLLALTDPCSEDCAEATVGAIRSKDEDLANAFIDRMTPRPDISLIKHTARHAAAAGQDRILDRLLTIVPMEEFDEFGHELHTWLRSAATVGSLEMAENLLGHAKRRLELVCLCDLTSRAVHFGNREVSLLFFTRLQAAIKEEEGEVTTDEEEAILSTSIQRVLTEALTYGQHLILSRLLEALKKNDVKGYLPILISDLLPHAVSSNAPRCFQVLLCTLAEMPFTQGGNGLDMTPLLNDVLKKGDITMLEALLTTTSPLNAENLGDALDKAVQRSDSPSCMVELLIKAANENGLKEECNQAVTDQLGCAIEGKLEEVDVVQALVKGVALIDEPSLADNTRTPLFQAALYGLVGIVRILLDNGAKPDVREVSRDEWAPVHAAADNVEILQLLLAKGTYVDAKTWDGSTALFLAVKWECVDCVEELLRHNPDLTCRVNNMDLLSMALDNGATEIAAKLLDAGFDLCHTNARGSDRLALHMCVERNYTDILRRLLLHNVPIELRDDQERTPLNRLTATTDVATIHLLLQRGADVNTIDHKDFTPLSKAMILKNVQIAERLISSHASLDTLSGAFGTPLHLACTLGSLPMVRLLVEKGADPDIDQGGVYGTPFQAALQADEPMEVKATITAYLLQTKRVPKNQASVWWGSNLSVACLMGDQRVVEQLLGQRCEVDIVDRFGRRPIHFALSRSLDYVKLLRARGAELFAEDAMLRSALHFAVISGRLDLVKYIIRKNKSLVNHEDCDGWTPLFWALRPGRYWKWDDSERCDIIRELKEKNGASIMVRGAWIDGECAPLTLAKRYGHSAAIIELLTPDPSQTKSSSGQDFWWRVMNEPIPTADNLEPTDGFCDVCLLDLVGPYYTCVRCEYLALCFKCYFSKEKLHPEHSFTAWGQTRPLPITQTLDEAQDGSGEERPQEEGTGNEHDNEGRSMDGDDNSPDLDDSYPFYEDDDDFDID